MFVTIVTMALPERHAPGPHIVPLMLSLITFLMQYCMAEKLCYLLPTEMALKLFTSTCFPPNVIKYTHVDRWNQNFNGG